MSNRFSPQDPRHVEAYLEYRTIVGDTDNGTLLSRQEYDAVRERAAAASRNPLRVFWRNNVSGVDCRNVGPSSLCLCGHRLRDHDWMATETKAVKCRMQACKCRLFEFIPVHGSQDVKCRCKHSYADHDVLSRKCTRCAPRQAPPFHRTQRLSKPKQAASALCTGFMPSYTCSCGSAFAAHETVFETTSERREQGAPAVAGATGTDGDSLAFMGGLSGKAQKRGLQETWRSRSALDVLFSDQLRSCLEANLTSAPRIGLSRPVPALPLYPLTYPST
ncbi:conserved hypothetical protein [Neospora caninum Liverpool]|uniref:Protein FAM221A n=1 Tax=Neospora caninum (strain Liverpool) TaxID=572307 RepID=F0VDA8_NEOCL|nr:conserved hypothetical protein [Neospora caninum Liverpool]CBZ51623.1 conserved hypothetical protein [Neospora caninum Liverpool]|eukprot:XP_003881656.1 conserved hypothetical protein [Neospora caninum Liverpool]